MLLTLLHHTATFLRGRVFGLVKFYLMMLLIIVFVEWCLRRPIKRYGSRAHAHQFAWFLFRNSGIHDILLFAWFYRGMDQYLGFLNLHLLDKSSLPIRFVVIFVAVDLAQYWLHRLRHTRLVWPFHAMHHSAEILTPAGMDQVHPLDDYSVGVFLYPLLMVLGTYPGEWAAVVMVRKFADLMQHSEISWRFGPLYYIFVSPAFHRVHHSRRPEFQNKNFATHLSFWDFLFGTAASPKEIPTDYGINGVTMPTLASQVLQPLRDFYREFLRFRPAAERLPPIAPAEPE